MRLMRAFLAATLLAPLALAPPAAAQQRQTPQSRSELQLSFAPIVKRVQPAVVNVYASRTERLQRNPLFDDPIFRRFFGERGQGGPQSRTAQSLGSGVIVDASGYVVTNHHVIEGMTEVKVALPDRRELEADIVLRDPRTDLAVLKIKGKGTYPFVEFGDSDALEVGDLVLALGNPFGVGQTVTQGIVSALARTQVGVSDFGFFIQTDAAINPGNSGGALVDLNARLIGINSAILSRTGSNIGIGFAIPINMVRIVVDAARTGVKQVRRPWIGATLQALQKDIADSMGLDRPAGALVASLRDDSPAAAAGLKRGDVIVSVDNQQIDDPESFGWRIGTKVIGGQASFGVLRAGKPLTLAVKMVAAPETPARDAVKLRGRSPFTGATVMNLSPAVAEELSIETTRSGGAIVAEIEDNSSAAEVGLQKGDLVVDVNDTAIATSKDLQAATAQRQRLWKITIERGGQTFTTVLGG